MRVLLTVSPEKSIFQYMVPVLWALRTAGHEVCVASHPTFTDIITRSGLTAVPVGRNIDRWRAARLENPEQVEAGRKGLPEPLDLIEVSPEEATWDRALSGFADFVEHTYKEENFPVIGGLVSFCRQWQPDLIIWEPYSIAAPIAAKACGAAHARMLFSVDAFGGARKIFRRLMNQQPADRRDDPLAEWLGSYARKYGGDFTEDMTVGHFTIDQFPRSLQYEAEDLTYVRTQFIPYGGPASVPKWLWKPSARPRVGLTMGLTATETYDGYTFEVQDVLDALADLDIELVATIADAEKEKLARIPANARIVPYVPWHALVPTCSAIIHHAGLATLATTARYPVPQLALPYHFDQPFLGRKLTEQGAGLDLHTNEATGESVRAHLVRLLDEPRFTERAMALTEEIHALPTPNAIVPQLEELTAKHRTR